MQNNIVKICFIPLVMLASCNESKFDYQLKGDFVVSYEVKDLGVIRTKHIDATTITVFEDSFVINGEEGGIFLKKGEVYHISWEKRK